MLYKSIIDDPQVTQRDLKRTVGPEANHAAGMGLKSLSVVDEMTNGLELEH